MPKDTHTQKPLKLLNCTSKKQETVWVLTLTELLVFSWWVHQSNVFQSKCPSHRTCTQSDLKASLISTGVGAGGLLKFVQPVKMSPWNWIMSLLPPCYSSCLNTIAVQRSSHQTCNCGYLMTFPFLHSFGTIHIMRDFCWRCSGDESNEKNK